MSQWSEKEEETYRDSVSNRLDAILTQVKETNGRLRSAEVKIAVLSWGYALGAFITGSVFVWALSVIRKP